MNNFSPDKIYPKPLKIQNDAGKRQCVLNLQFIASECTLIHCCTISTYNIAEVGKKCTSRPIFARSASRYSPCPAVPRAAYEPCEAQERISRESLQ